MEARSALLGDLRTNHPDRWTRPELWGQQSGQRVDFHAVHVVVQVRLDDKADTDLLHPRLKDKVQALGQAATGLRVLAAEPMRSYRDDKNHHAVGHMGIADGLSQPKLPSGATNDFTHYNDQVSTGELLLGYANDRGDLAPEPKDKFLHNGTFLVVRKLRQFMDRLDAVAPVTTTPGKALLEKMVGRAADGTPLHGLPADVKHENDFRFDSQPASDACPFHSHVRRTNPRDGRAYTPRILRRGMSWGERSDTDRTTARGVMFMAYCASLAEQFETIQRWVAGGNASGVGSAQGDPLLRVPMEGEAYTFRYLADGKVQRVELPKEPLVQLQWGLYAFVPSLAVLSSLVDFTKQSAVEADPQPEQGLSDLEAARALLEDREKSEAVWDWVRQGDSRAPQDGAYGHLVGKLDEVLTVLRDDGTKYSVHGYAERMDGSIGLNLLGMDPAHPRRAKELGVNKVIAAVSEGLAFAEALTIAQTFLSGIRPLPTATDDHVERYPVDLSDFSAWVLARLCQEWFGLPDELNLADGGYQPGPPTKPRCPGSLGPASRYMFMPHPRADEHANFAADGRAHAKAVRKAVGTWLAGNPDLSKYRLSREIEAALAQTQSEAHLADNIAGTMLGFTPSVQSNFLRVMQTWLEDGSSLWVHQQSLFELSGTESLDYAQARDALRKPLLAAIRKHPVPTMAWRSPVVNGEPDTSPSKRVVLGLQSALADPAVPDVAPALADPDARHLLVFGRDHPEYEKNTTVHGCPGYDLAIGVLLAMISALMKAGTLRPTGSAVLLILTKQKEQS
jgi:Dyp-type peroxidase family